MMSSYQNLQYIIKVCLDRFFAVLLLVILFPGCILISILIKLESNGSIIYKQKRLGKHGNTFTIYKFRTMCDNAANIGDGIFISKNDSRITKVGKYLRKASLDELPQIVNILKGEMSFVGPRPPLVHHPYEYEEYDNVQQLRFVILPGITGYAQAYGRNAIKWPERIKMDVYYYREFSLLLDIKILLATAFAVILSKGTYSNRNNTEKQKDIEGQKG